MTIFLYFGSLYTELSLKLIWPLWHSWWLFSISAWRRACLDGLSRMPMKDSLLGFERSNWKLKWTLKGDKLMKVSASQLSAISAHSSIQFEYHVRCWSGHLICASCASTEWTYTNSSKSSALDCSVVHDSTEEKEMTCCMYDFLGRPCDWSLLSDEFMLLQSYCERNKLPRHQRTLQYGTKVLFYPTHSTRNITSN